MYLSCFSPTVRRSGIPFPPQGLPRMGFPCFTGTMGCSETLPPVSPHFVAFAWRYHACAAAFRVRPLAAPAAPRRTGGGPGVYCAGCPIPALNVETTGLPRFLGNPGVGVPCSSTPTGPAGPGLYSPTDAAFRSHKGVGSRDGKIISGLNHTAHPLAVYASQPGLLPNHARLASGCWPTLPGGIDYPLGSTARFSVS